MATVGFGTRQFRQWRLERGDEAGEQAIIAGSARSFGSSHRSIAFLPPTNRKTLPPGPSLRPGDDHAMADPLEESWQAGAFLGWLR